MKTEYQQVFSEAVVAKVKQADAIGSKTSWTTKDHLEALAITLLKFAKSQDSDGKEQKAKVLEILTECYNVSAFAQTLEKVEAFKKSGHFQRTGKGTPTLDSLLASLNAAATAQG